MFSLARVIDNTDEKQNIFNSTIVFLQNLFHRGCLSFQIYYRVDIPSRRVDSDVSTEFQKVHRIQGSSANQAEEVRQGWQD